jgi:hypothetical protein
MIFDKAVEKTVTDTHTLCDAYSSNSFDEYCYRYVYVLSAMLDRFLFEIESEYTQEGKEFCYHCTSFQVLKKVIKQSDYICVEKDKETSVQ